jgi:hypothetical protein
LRGDADDGEGQGLDVDSLAEDRSLTREAGGPVGVAEHRERCVRGFVFEGEAAAARESHAEAREKISADHIGFGFFGVRADAHGHFVFGERYVGHQLGKSGRFFA